MKEDIDFPKVDKVGVCAVPDEKEGMKVWVVHVLNMLPGTITNVLVSTRGYGKKDDQEVKTSQLRHYFEEVKSMDTRQVEIVPQDLEGLNNQFWVSYYYNDQLFDKKFIFLPDSLIEDNMMELPVLKQKGILII
jgi:hypothetical protein